jgi:hypothetical protein
MRYPLQIRRFTLLLLVALFSLAALAQSSAFKPGTPVLMWKVSSKTNTAYLLGSVHVGDKSMYPLPDVIEDAFDAASVLIVEVDMTKVNQAQLQQLMMTLGSYPEGDDLFQHISPRTRARLDTFLGQYGIPPAAFAQYRPWLAALSVTMFPMIKAGVNPSEGIDMYFLNKAKGKRIEQLEDAEWQVKLFAEFPEKVSDAVLSRSIIQAASINEHYAKLASLWSHGDAVKIDELTKSWSAGESAEERAFDRRLREERNPHMTQKLEQCLQSSETCFMVVGAAHVIGSQGIVKQLQAHGYRVQQAVVGAK